MPTLSTFANRGKPIIPQSNEAEPISRLNFRGLDLVTPYDAIEEGRTPSAKNFRLYSQEEDDRRVAVSNRRGSELYTVPLEEAQDFSNEHDTEFYTYPVGIVTNWQAVKIEPTVTGQLTMVEFEMSNPDEASGPIIVELRANRDGFPGDVIASTGYLGSEVDTDLAFVQARFIEAPRVLNGTHYWLSQRMQSDGTGEYLWGATDSATIDSAASNTTANSWDAVADVGFNFKTHITPDATNKGVFRYSPEDGDNTTLAAINRDVYAVNDETGALSSILGLQTAQDTDYMFSTADNRAFWVNGFDTGITNWDGSTYADNDDIVANGTFESNTNGWAGAGGSTISRVTTQSHSGVASLQSVTTITQATTVAAYTFTKDNQYTMKAWVKGTAGNKIKLTAGGQDDAEHTFTGNWDELTFTFIAQTASASNYGAKAVTASQTYWMDDVTVKHTGINVLTHTQLNDLYLGTFHKNRFFGVEAADRNRLVYSEDPGNDDGAGNEWYRAWLSTSFIYIPYPKAGDPITAIIPFQDNLVVFTRTNKYVLYGSDPGSFTVRQSTGRKGAVHQRGVWADANYVYFISDDGVYRHNGSSDELISDRVQPEFAGIPDVEETCLTGWKHQIRMYYATPLSSVNNRCLIWHTTLEEWMMDTDTYVSYAVPMTDGNDVPNLIEMSSNQPTLLYADQNPHNLGKQIDFEYQCNYDSFGIPAVRKRINKFFPLIEGEGGNYIIQVGVDRDRKDAIRWFDYEITTSAPLIGEFLIGDGTLIGSNTSFKPRRVRVPGYGYYWQPRIRNNAINNKVHFIGYVLSIRAKRL